MAGHRRLTAQELVAAVFTAADRMDVDTYVTHIAENGRLRFANDDAVVGRLAIHDAITAFYRKIEETKGVTALEHEILGVWEANEVITADLVVTYFRVDDSTITLPGATIWRMDGGLIKDYKIFIDHGPLWAA